jgi:hypothetical protein
VLHMYWLVHVTGWSAAITDRYIALLAAHTDDGISQQARPKTLEETHTGERDDVMGSCKCLFG